ncbi:MAG: DNA alkylation repair protein [Defluviitaleaceae bacterium]|nr:DNA alkylation repair protein [Defluviitaleaceae bacterium]
MPEPLKNVYNRETLQNLAQDIQAVYSPFPIEPFLDAILDETWPTLELKARGRKITLALGKFLPQSYPQAIAIIDKIVANYGGWLDGGFSMFFPDFVEVYGQAEADWDTSMAAMALYTHYASAEFAVRPFIINHEARMMAQMLAWSKSDDEDLRRLASEGCRPALPWTQALPRFKADPSPVLLILEGLKADPSLYVRRSVANNLNDISKTHPALVVEIAQKWYGQNDLTNLVVKHACRSLLKKGNREALSLFGFGGGNHIETSGFAVTPTKISIGQPIEFSFTITTKKATKARLEYGIDYVKSNGKRNRKIFQISEIALEANQTKPYTKKHSLADVSVRKHYPGVHSITLIVNGTEHGTLDFELSI